MSIFNDENDLIERVRAGDLDPSHFETGPGLEFNSPVSISDLVASFSGPTGQLSVYCTATVNDPGESITGVGMIVYSADGRQTFCLQYCNGFNGKQVTPNVGTKLYSPAMGDRVMCVVYGWTQNAGHFYVTETISVQNW